MLRAAARWVGVVATAFVVCGCPEPHTKFNEFVERSPVVDASVGDGGPTMLQNVTGRFLLSIATTIAPDTPLQFITEATLTMNADGTGTLSLTSQALAASTRMPVGNMIVLNNIPVNAMGQFSANFGTVMVPAAANPITNGDITAMLTLNGTTVSPDRFCGTIVGMVISPLPLDLAGSMWGAIRVPAGAIGSALPPPDASCPTTSSIGDGGTIHDGGARDGALLDAHPAG
jgi:hypothetical protein